MRWLHDPQHDVNEAAKGFANMVLAHFDEIAATARQRNARSAALAGLARLHLVASPAELPEIDMPAAAEQWPWRRLKELTVRPFRGFWREEQFDLRRRVILFFAPNGSGKTSLCEALERGLSGSVEEAELKLLAVRREDLPKIRQILHEQAGIRALRNLGISNRRQIVLLPLPFPEAQGDTVQFNKRVNVQ